MALRRTLIAAASLAALLLPAAPAAADGGCTKVAGPGSSASEFVDSLSPGDVGCLRQGSYDGDDIRFDEPGATLRSYPGEQATIKAFLEVYPDAVGARLNHLKFDSAGNGNAVGVKIQADKTVFSDNEVTKGGKGICLLAGSWNKARDVVIERNRIYDCGPGNSKYDHQIYLGGTRDAIVRWNILSKNGGGWGVHLYPDADGTLVEHNIIDGNRGGVVFAGEGGETSDGNVVRNNALTHSGPRWNLEGSWSGGPEGNGNLAKDNCVYTGGPDGPDGIAQREGFNASSNRTLDGSPYANRAAGDYRFRADSPCAALVGDVVGKITGKPSLVPPPPVTVILKPVQPAVKPKSSVVLKGQVRTKAAGKVKVSKVKVQIRRGRRWRTMKTKRLRKRGKFSLRMRTPRSRRKRTLKVRAVVPGMARSRTVGIRVKP